MKAPFRLLLSFFSTLFLISGSLLAQPVDLYWAHNIGAFSSEFPGGILVDDCGHVYVAGTFQSTMDLDPGPDEFLVTPSDHGDGFIAKFSPTGVFLWGKTLSGDWARISEMALTQDGGSGCGQLALAGFFSGTVDFDPSANVAFRDQGSDLGPFLLKLDENGNFEWVRTWGNSGNFSRANVHVDSNGDILFSSTFTGTVDFDPGPGQDIFETEGRDAFITKYDTDGNYQWTSMLRGPALYAGIGTDAQGEIYATGDFLEKVDFDPGPDSVFQVPSGSWELFRQKQDANGDFVWAKRAIGINGYLISQGLTVDPQGKSTIVGSFERTVNFNPGFGAQEVTATNKQNLFVAQYHETHHFHWLYTVGDQLNTEATAVVHDPLGVVYVTGKFRGTIDFDPGPGVAELVSDSVDMFVLSLSPTGEFQWVRQIGGEGTQIGTSLDWRNDNLYFSGYSDKTATAHFDNGSATIYNRGARDVIFGRIELNTILGVEPSSDEGQVQVYPNPATETVTINADPTAFQTATLLNIHGQTVIPRATLTGRIDISHLPTGVYLLRLEGPEGSLVKRIVKQ